MTRMVDPEGRETEILRRIATFHNKDVLDIGCGEGRTTRHIAKTAASVLGLDPDEERIARARETAREQGFDQCVFRAADVVTLELPKASFDVGVFSRSL